VWATQGEEFFVQFSRPRVSYWRRPRRSRRRRCASPPIARSSGARTRPFRPRRPGSTRCWTPPPARMPGSRWWFRKIWVDEASAAW